MRSRMSSFNVTSTAPSCDSSWSIVRGPMIGEGTARMRNVWPRHWIVVIPPYRQAERTPQRRPASPGSLGCPGRTVRSSASARLDCGATSPLRYCPLSQPPLSGLHGMTPIRTSRHRQHVRLDVTDKSNTAAARRERAQAARSAIHCASTICCAGYVDEPKARILPWRWRSVSADSVSSSGARVRAGGSGTGRSSPCSAGAGCPRPPARSSDASCPVCSGHPRRAPAATSIGAWNFVARITLSRRPGQRLAEISSDSPCE